MRKLDENIARFIELCLVRGSENVELLVNYLEENDEGFLTHINNTTVQFGFSFEVEIACYEMLNEACKLNITRGSLSLALSSSWETAKRMKNKESNVLPVWTGPIFQESPVIQHTYETVKQLIKTAKYEVLIVGYTFSFENSLLLDLYDEIINAIKRNCRIQIIFNNNQKNSSELIKRWPKNLSLPDFYYWRGDDESKWASLHSKLIMVDQEKLLLTSANFTLHGFYKNIETGVLIERHPLVIELWKQFRSLILNKEMMKLNHEEII